MSSLLAAMTGWMKYVTDRQIQSYDRPEIFYAKAIRLLRPRLKEVTRYGKQMIVDIFFLSTVDVYDKSFDGVRTHPRVIRRSIDYVGGVRSIRSFCARDVLE
jgi:hypothetical protein